MKRYPLVGGALCALCLAIVGCQTDGSTPVQLSTGGSPFEYESKPVGDPSMDPYSPSDPAQIQRWIKPPPTAEELRQGAGSR